MIIRHPFFPLMLPIPLIISSLTIQSTTDFTFWLVFSSETRCEVIKKAVVPMSVLLLAPARQIQQ